MYGLLADVNCEGHVAALLQICRAEPWRDLWNSLEVQLFTFESVGLNADAPDSKIWRTCQAERLFLVTANRNDDGPESLQRTITNENAIDSLPVLTLADAGKILSDIDYRQRAAIRLMEILLDPDAEMGTGWLYLPRDA